MSNVMHVTFGEVHVQPDETRCVPITKRQRDLLEHAAALLIVQAEIEQAAIEGQTATLHRLARDGAAPGRTLGIAADLAVIVAQWKLSPTLEDTRVS